MHCNLEFFRERCGSGLEEGEYSYAWKKRCTLADLLKLYRAL